MFGSLLPMKSSEGEEDIEETDAPVPSKEGEKEGEARDYMADILLAKNNLSSLQKQVSGKLEMAKCPYFSCVLIVSIYCLLCMCVLCVSL